MSANLPSTIPPPPDTQREIELFEATVRSERDPIKAFARWHMLENRRFLDEAARGFL